MVYEHLAKNWMVIADLEEHPIMVKYAKIGKIYSNGYIACAAAAAVSFSQLPAVPVILDVLFPLNQSRTKILYVKSEVIIDPHEHYVTYYMYFLVTSASTVLVFMCIDSTYCVIIHQILALLSVTKRRLHNATKAEEIKKDNSYDIIVTAISIHQESINFVKLIEASYTECLLYLVISTAICLSFGAIAILNSKTVFDTIRFVMMGIAVVFQIFYLSFNAQKIIDSSNDLSTAIYATDWYNISSKSKKLLKFMILRTSKPMFFTAGGFYVMSIRNFGLIMKTTASYITVLSSFK